MTIANEQPGQVETRRPAKENVFSALKDMVFQYGPGIFIFPWALKNYVAVYSGLSGGPPNGIFIPNLWTL